MAGVLRQPLKSAEGPAKLVETKGYSTTTILSSLKKCEARQQLRRGTASGESIPASRVAERVFGVGGPGRSKLLSTGIHIENLGSMYDPRGWNRVWLHSHDCWSENCVLSRL